MESGKDTSGNWPRPDDLLLATSSYFESFRSIDESLGCPIFLKVSQPSNDADTRAIIDAHVALWRRLARTQPASMPVFRAIEARDDRWLLTTQWIEGLSLREMLTTVPIREPVAFLNRLTRQSLIALDELHRKRIVHGDLSPGNVLIDTSSLVERVWLIDPAPLDPFPALPGRSDRRVIGTPGWMAPEQRAGDTPDALSDLFSLGLLLKETARRLGISAPPIADLLASPARDGRPPSAQAAYWINDSGEKSFLDFHSVRPTREGRFEGTDQTIFRRGWDAGTGVGQPLYPSASPERFEHRDLPDAPIWGNVAGASIDWQSSSPDTVPKPDAWAAVSQALAAPVPRPNSIERADFLVVAPTPILPGRHFIIELWIAPVNRRAEMQDLAFAAGRMKERGGRAFVDLERDTLLRIVLTLPDFDVAMPVETLGWDGDIRNAGFMVKAPAALVPGVYPGMMKLARNDVPFITIQFDLEVTALEPGPPPPPRSLDVKLRRIERAFGSYSRDDRSEVLRRAQGIKAAGIDLFLDIIDVRAGTDWEKHLYREIDRADGLFLFWSRNAARSEWVEREWRYALARRGLDFINPLPLEDPRLVAPPEELKSRHFADMLLFFIDAEDARRVNPGDAGPSGQAGS